MTKPRRSTEMIVVHCSATPPNMDIGAKEIDRWHRAKGWLKCGYHIVIRRDGRSETEAAGFPCRAIHVPGAHAGPKYNPKSIGICLIGGVDAKGKPEDNFTQVQFLTLEAALRTLLKIYPDINTIVGHGNLPGVAKACPSFDVSAFLASKDITVGVTMVDDEDVTEPIPEGKGWVVAPKDTYWSIAKTLGCTVNDIAVLNPTIDPVRLPIGRTIRIP